MARTSVACRERGFRGSRARGLVAVLFLLAVGAASRPAWSEVGPITVPALDDARFSVMASNQFRAEVVDWWRPSNGSAPGRYDFQANRAKLGVGVKWRRLESFVQLQHTFLRNVPVAGVGPGGVYWANSHRKFQAAFALRNAWLRVAGIDPDGRVSVTLGRQPYRSGLEVPIEDPHLAHVVSNRVAERLIGVREYSMIGRSFDGARVDVAGDRVAVTAFGFLPTRGGFEIDANKNISEIQIAGAVVSPRTPTAWGAVSTQLFYYLYRDTRDLVVLDNRPLAVRAADRGQTLLIHSAGGHAARAWSVGPGTVDALAWGVGQLGDWQGLKHRAWAWAIEGGYQVPRLWGSPWLRAGIDRGSGDDDPGDRSHTSFYQLLPTARRRARTPFYNLMNNQDVFTQLQLEPFRGVTALIGGHWLRVNSTRDFAYAGGGPTSESVFGYGGRPSGGRRELAYLADVSLNWQVNSHLSLYAYYGHAFGQGIVAAASRNRALNYAFFEVFLTL